MAVRKLGLLVCALAVLASGCGSMSAALRDMGLESRGSRLYRAEKAKNERLAALAAESESQLAAAMAERDDLLAQLAKSKDGPEIDVAAPAPKPVDNSEMWKRLGGLGEIIVAPDGTKALRMKGDLFFRSGKATVRSEARAVVSKIAAAIKQHGDVVVYVDGHTDSDPLRYTKRKYGDNYGLGGARATAVAEQLVAMGVPRSQLITRSFGKDRPIADNTTRAGKSKNRRVEFTLARNSGTARTTEVSLER